VRNAADAGCLPLVESVHASPSAEKMAPCQPLKLNMGKLYLGLLLASLANAHTPLEGPFCDGQPGQRHHACSFSTPHASQAGAAPAPPGDRSVSAFERWLDCL